MKRRVEAIEPIAAEPQDLSVAELFTQIQQQLSPEQQQHLIALLSAEDDASSANPLT